VAVATVIDRVFSASVDPALKQAQLSEKLWGGWAAGPSLSRTAERIPSKFRTWRDRSAYR
jgi:hypothetical protein